MGKLKLLFITQDLTHNVEQWTHEFIEELEKNTELVVWNKEGDLKGILNAIPMSPDFILLNDMRIEFCPEITNLTCTDIPLGILFCDGHFNEEGRKEFIYNNGIQYIFSFTRDYFYRKYGEFRSRMFWFPHFVNTKIFRDYELAKKVNYLMMGLLWEEYYPLRKKIFNVMKNEEGFVHYEHPGYKALNMETALVGERYAKKINESKMFLTDGGLFNYVVRKYYEVPACKTLLLAPNNKELRDLGFVEGIHFIPIDEEDCLRKGRYFLTHDKEREDIVKEGYKMVHEKHSVEKRVAEFLIVIEEILKSHGAIQLEKLNKVR